MGAINSLYHNALRDGGSTFIQRREGLNSNAFDRKFTLAQLSMAHQLNSVGGSSLC